MKYYLAGPMSGHPQFNYPLFDSVSAALRERGLDITSPAEMDIDEVREAAMKNMTGKMDENNAVSGETWGDFLARDVKLIADELNAIILLPEWETSKGARLEAFVAINCGYPAFVWFNGDVRPVENTYIMERINESIL
jgi:hypothetical protein